MLPWSLFLVVLVTGVGGVVLEKQKLDAAELRASVAARAEEKTRAELSDVAASNRALGIRVQELQNEVGHLTVKAAVSRAEPHPRVMKKARRKHRRHRH